MKQKNKLYVMVAVMVFGVIGIYGIYRVDRNLNNRLPCSVEVYRDQVPEELQSYILENDAFSMIEVDDKRYLVCERNDIGSYLQHNIEATVVRDVLHIRIKRIYADSEMFANGSTFYALVSVPENIEVHSIKLAYDTVT